VNDTIREMADQLLRELQAKVDALRGTPQMAEVLALHRALNGLEDAVPRERTTLYRVLGLEPEGDSSGARKVDLRAWEFTNKTPLQAAKLYLQKAGEPRYLEDIVTAIKSHGGEVGNVEQLATQLTRSTADVVKVKGQKNDMFGLVEHFPGMKRAVGKWKVRPANQPTGYGDEKTDELDLPEEPEEGGESDGQEP
jgi:hypothetical protein